jgi:hypothetical protein
MGGLCLLFLLFPAWASAGAKGTVLWYLEREAGIEPYKVRYIITDDFLRSDEGDTEGGYLLFDRKRRHIYSVAPESTMIIGIDGKGSLPEVPGHLSIQVKREVDQEAPKVEGQSPVTMELLANGETCYSAVVVPGMLDQARAALQEFMQALAVQQSRTLASTPKEYQTPCFLSRYLYATDFFLKQGIALVHWSNASDRRELLEYQTDVELEEQLFELPRDYQVIWQSGD